MKKNLTVIALVICGMLAFAGSSWAIMAGSTNVGGLDNSIESTTLSNSSYGGELAWINEVLGTSYLSFDKYDTVACDWTLTNVSGVYAMALNGTPDYFMIKLGVGRNDTTDTHLLFANNANFSWAVIALGDGDYEIKNIGKLSHVGEIGGGGNGCNGDCTKVPEPGMLLLLGSGLIALGFFGRKNFRK